MKEKKENEERRIPVRQVLLSSRVRDLEDHKVLFSLQLRLPVRILFYLHHQLQVHKEVLLGDKMFLVVLSVGEDTRESVGD